MHYLREAFITVVALAVGVASALAQQPPRDLVKAQLVADVAAVQPGQTITLGVLFEMKPDWHIYWHNPGDSGLATSIRFELPEGWTVGPVLWPAPIRFVQPGDILGYGYEGSVLLAAKVVVPDDLSSQTPVPVRAKTRWLSCKDVCIPGNAELESTLPVSDAPESANEHLFTDWEESLPVEAFSAGVQVSLAGKLPRDGSPGEFSIKLKFGSATRQVEWYPYESRALRITDATVRSTGTQVDVQFKAALLKGQKLDANELPTVITYKDAEGMKRAIRVSVPLRGTD